MTCAYCGTKQPLSELVQFDNGFITCKDILGCNGRVAQAEHAYYTSLQSELKRVEARRSELITLIEKQRLKMGLPDATIEHHRAEMARIEQEG